MPKVYNLSVLIKEPKSVQLKYTERYVITYNIKTEDVWVEQYIIYATSQKNAHHHVERQFKHDFKNHFVTIKSIQCV